MDQPFETARAATLAALKRVLETSADGRERAIRALLQRFWPKTETAAPLG